MREATDIDPLIELVYDAAVEPIIWPRFLDAFCDFVHARCCWLVDFDADANSVATIATARQTPEFEQRYLEEFAGDMPWGRRVPGLFDEGTVRTLASFVSDDELQRSRYYQEWMAPQQLNQMLTICLLRRDHLFTGLSLHRSEGEPAFDDGDIERVQQVVPHMRKAVRLRQQVVKLRKQRDAVRAAIDRIEVGIVILDREGRPEHMNRAASRLVGNHDGLYATSKALKAESNDENNRLQELMFNATARMEDRSGGALRVPRPSGHRPLQVLVCALPPATEGDAAGGAGVVFITDPDAGVASLSVTLERLFELTPTEARVAQLLMAGHSIQETADQLGMEVSTARSHLKRIFRKTDTNRQSELIRVMLRSCAVIHTDG